MLLQTSEVKIKEISNKNNVGVFEYAPLPSGFGSTLGTALRRVLLTSLESGAITEVTFDKATHEFTTIEGVKEDVVELTLNLKGVIVKMHTDAPVTGTISKKGKGEVTAADIEVSSEVEIINKKHHIADLADSKSTFDASFVFEKSHGYRPSENTNTSNVNSIAVDAIFSPVINVSYSVEETRKGDVVGLDKLTIEVTTDGSVDPEEALTQANTILRNFFSRFSKGPDPEEVVVIEENDTSPLVNASEEIYLEDLSLPTRTINALKKQNISTLKDLAKLNDEELADIKNLGEKSVIEIKKILESEGLRESE